MSRQLDRELLADLARLAKRYPPESWESLIDWLQDDHKRHQVVTLLKELAQISKGPVARSTATGRLPALSRLIEEVRGVDERKATLVESFWRRLTSRELLNSMSSVRNFAEISGLRVPTAKKREQAINDVVRQLLELPSAEIERVLENASKASTDLGEDYERWVRLILDR